MTVVHHIDHSVRTRKLAGGVTSVRRVGLKPCDACVLIPDRSHRRRPAVYRTRSTLPLRKCGEACATPRAVLLCSFERRELDAIATSAFISRTTSGDHARRKVGACRYASING